MHCYDVSKRSVSFRYQLKRLCDVLIGQSHLGTIGTSLRGLKLVCFIYVLVRRRKNISNRSLLLMYQLRHRGDVSAWSRKFKLVTKMGQFLLGTRQYVFRHLRWFSLIKVPASTSLQRLKDVGLI